MPDRTETQNHEPRRVGVEIEFAGLGIETIAAILADELGGTIEVDNRYESRVTGDAAGDWRVEFDFALLKTWARKQSESSQPQPWLEVAAEDLLRMGSEQVVPMEVVSPPLPMERLAEVDVLIARLRDAGAVGTRESWVYAFGVHLNPELPGLSAEEIVAYLKAFLCLFDWIVEEESIDRTRRLMPYIDAFPEAYVRQVVDPGYWPGVETLIDEYLLANATRNRALDMLPLFAELDEARVRAAVDDLRIKSRPTLHYRLPNCEIDHPKWGIANVWRHWLLVEELAQDRRRLDDLCSQYCDFLDRGLGRMLHSWPDAVRTWLLE